MLPPTVWYAVACVQGTHPIAADVWHSRPRLCELPCTAEGGCATEGRLCVIHQIMVDGAGGRRGSRFRSGEISWGGRCVFRGGCIDMFHMFPRLTMISLGEPASARFAGVCSHGRHAYEETGVAS